MSMRDKLNARMDLLQHKMESNYHMEGEQAVYELQTLIDSVTFAWSVLSEEDQDYIHGCQYAIDEQIEWRV
jgi:hypothetical protein